MEITATQGNGQFLINAAALVCTALGIKKLLDAHKFGRFQIHSLLLCLAIILLAPTQAYIICPVYLYFLISDLFKIKNGHFKLKAFLAPQAIGLATLFFTPLCLQLHQSLLHNDSPPIFFSTLIYSSLGIVFVYCARIFFGDQLLWLRNIDQLAKYTPRRLVTFGPLRTPQKMSCALVRPGGLGDLVLLTRACRDLGLNPLAFTWIIELRNSPWLDYLKIPYVRYDIGDTLLQVAQGHLQYTQVLNTEQTFGLSALFARRICARGTLLGFSSNTQKSLYDVVIDYDLQRQHLLDDFKQSLQMLAPTKTPGAYTFPTITPTSQNHHVVVALGGLQHHYKRLSLEQWTVLINRAQRESDRVLLVGSGIDGTFAKALAQRCASKLQNLVGEIPFSEVVSLISSSKRLYSVDSGLVHVADFFDIPSDVVFTGASISKWRALAPGSTILGVRDLN